MAQDHQRSKTGAGGEVGIKPPIRERAVPESINHKERPTMSKYLLRIVAMAGFALAAALPVTASAAGGPFQPGVNVTIGSPITLQSKLLVTVPVTVSCPIAFAGAFQFGDVSAAVMQANGKSVSQGNGDIQLAGCDANPQTVYVQVLPTTYPTASGPFHGGQAIVTASALVCDTTFACYGGSAGPIAAHF
jgi:hypothetical protein